MLPETSRGEVMFHHFPRVGYVLRLWRENGTDFGEEETNDKWNKKRRRGRHCSYRRLERESRLCAEFLKKNTE